MPDENEDSEMVPILRGEAPQDRFGFKTEQGEQADPGPAIFPIIKWGLDGQIDLLATGFFIGPNIFVTARHVVEAAFDHRTGQQAFSAGMIHFYEAGRYFIRPILRGMSHRVADVAVGVVAPMTRNSDGAPLENKRLVISTSTVGLDAHVMTYAYPRYRNICNKSGQIIKLLPAYYDGRIIEHLPGGRDRVLLPGPCYRTSIAIHHGASGGPVFSRDGAVFAVNSTGFDGTDDSYVSSIGALFDLIVDDISVDGEPPGKATVRELARLGHVSVSPPL
jgi:hypothetical protein